MKNLADVDRLLNRHLEEASEGIVDTPPSRLRRGQAVEKDYYILKVDLARSTSLLRGRHKATYLKVIHSFLSTVDGIVQYYGADTNQTEYAGDSVIAYFPAWTEAEDVLRAAIFSKIAVERLANMQRDIQLKTINCRIVIHYATLIVAKIGPRASSYLIAIGHPIHRVAKIEDTIAVGVGRATKEFYSTLELTNRKFLTPIFEETQVMVPTTPEPWETLPGLGLLSLASQEYKKPVSPVYKTEKALIGYDVNWSLIKTVFKLYR